MHYLNRANVYKVLGRGVFGSCCCCPLLFVRICGGGSHVGNSSVVALVFGFGMDSCQISVILNQDSVGMLVSFWYGLVSNLDSVGMLVSFWYGLVSNFCNF